MELLGELSAGQDTILVSHQPFVSIFVAFLTGQRVPMGTAWLACVEVDHLAEGQGELMYVLEPL